MIIEPFGASNVVDLSKKVEAYLKERGITDHSKVTIHYATIINHHGAVEHTCMVVH